MSGDRTFRPRARNMVRDMAANLKLQAREGVLIYCTDVDQDGYVVIEGKLSLTELAMAAERAYRREFG